MKILIADPNIEILRQENEKLKNELEIRDDLIKLLKDKNEALENKIKVLEEKLTK